MKLHLPTRLRKALLACLASMVIPAFSVTVSSGSALASGAALVSFLLSQSAQAEDGDDGDDATDPIAEDALEWVGGANEGSGASWLADGVWQGGSFTNSGSENVSFGPDHTNTVLVNDEINVNDMSVSGAYDFEGTGSINVGGTLNLLAGEIHLSVNTVAHGIHMEETAELFLGDNNSLTISDNLSSIGGITVNGGRLILGNGNNSSETGRIGGGTFGSTVVLNIASSNAWFIIGGGSFNDIEITSGELSITGGTFNGSITGTANSKLTVETAGSVRVNSNVEVGTLDMRDNKTLHVSGNLTLLNSGLKTSTVSPKGNETIEVEGNVTLNLNGNVEYNGNLVTASGNLLTLSGSGTQTLSHDNLTLASNILIGSGVTLKLSGLNAILNGDITLGNNAVLSFSSTGASVGRVLVESGNTATLAVRNFGSGSDDNEIELGALSVASGATLKLDPGQANGDCAVIYLTSPLSGIDGELQINNAHLKLMEGGTVNGSLSMDWGGVITLGGDLIFGANATLSAGTNSSQVASNAIVAAGEETVYLMFTMSGNKTLDSFVSNAVKSLLSDSGHVGVGIYATADTNITDGGTVAYDVKISGDGNRTVAFQGDMTFSGDVYVESGKTLSFSNNANQRTSTIRGAISGAGKLLLEYNGSLTLEQGGTIGALTFNYQTNNIGPSLYLGDTLEVGSLARTVSANIRATIAKMAGVEGNVNLVININSADASAQRMTFDEGIVVIKRGSREQKFTDGLTISGVLQVEQGTLRIDGDCSIASVIGKGGTLWLEGNNKRIDSLNFADGTVNAFNGSLNLSLTHGGTVGNLVCAWGATIELGDDLTIGGTDKNNSRSDGTFNVASGASASLVFDTANNNIDIHDYDWVFSGIGVSVKGGNTLTMNGMKTGTSITTLSLSGGSTLALSAALSAGSLTFNGDAGNTVALGNNTLTVGSISGDGTITLTNGGHLSGLSSITDTITLTLSGFTLQDLLGEGYALLSDCTNIEELWNHIDIRFNGLTYEGYELLMNADGSITLVRQVEEGLSWKADTTSSDEDMIWKSGDLGWNNATDYRNNGEENVSFATKSGGTVKMEGELQANFMSVNGQEYTFQKNDGFDGTTTLTVTNLQLEDGAVVNINGVKFTVNESIEVNGGNNATISVTNAQLDLGDGVNTTANISLSGSGSLSTSGDVTIGTLSTDEDNATVSLGGTLTVSGATDLSNFTFVVNDALTSYALGDADDTTAWLEQIIDETVSKTPDQLGTYETGTGFKKSGTGTLTITSGTLAMPIWVNQGGLTLGSGVAATGDILVTTGGTLTLNGNTLGDVTMNGGAINLGASAVTFHDLTINSITNGSTSNKMGTINVTGTLTVAAGQNFFVEDSTINNVDCAGTLCVSGKENSGMGTRINRGSINALYFMWQDNILTLGGDLEVGAIGGTLADVNQYINKAADVTGPVHLILTSLNKLHNHAVDVSTFNGFLNMYRVRKDGVRSKVTINTGVGVSGLALTFAVGSNTSASETWSNDFIVKGATGGTSGSLTINGADGVTGASFAMESGKTLTVGANATLTLNALLDLGSTGALAAKEGSTIALGANGGLKLRGSLSLDTFTAVAGSTLSLSAFNILSTSADAPLITFNTGASGSLALDLTGLTLAEGVYQLFGGTFNGLALGVSGFDTANWSVTYVDGTLSVVKYGDTITWVGDSGTWSAGDTETGEWENKGVGVTFADPHTGESVNVLFDANGADADTITVSGAVSVEDMTVKGNYVFAAGTNGSLTVGGDLELSDSSASFGVGVTLAGELTGNGSLTVANGGSLTLRSSSSGYTGTITLSRTGANAENAALIFESGETDGSNISLGGNITLTSRASGSTDSAQYVIYVKGNDTVSIGNADGSSELNMNGENIIFYSANSKDNYINSALTNRGIIKLIGNGNKTDPAVNLHLTHALTGSETDTTFETHRHTGNGPVNLYLDGAVSGFAHLKTVDVNLYLTDTLTVGADGLAINSPVPGSNTTYNGSVYVQGSLVGNGAITLSAGTLTLGGEQNSDLSDYEGTLTVSGGTLNISSVYAAGLTLTGGTTNVLADVSSAVTMTGGTLNVQSAMSGSVTVQSDRTATVTVAATGSVGALTVTGQSNLTLAGTAASLNVTSSPRWTGDSINTYIHITSATAAVTNGFTSSNMVGIEFASGSQLTIGGAISIGDSTDGNLRLAMAANAATAGTLVLNSGGTIYQRLVLEDDITVKLATGTTLTVGWLQDYADSHPAGGTITTDGTATLKISGAQVTNYTAAGLTFASGITLELINGATQTLSSVTINGDVQMDGANAVLTISGESGNSFAGTLKGVGGTMNVTGTLAFSGEVDTTGGASLKLTEGTLNLSHSDETAHDLGTIAVTTSGTLSVGGGTWNLAGLTGDAAAVSINSDATLVLGSTASLSRLSLEGTLKFGKGSGSGATANQLTVVGTGFSFGANGKLAIDSTGLDTATALLAFTGDTGCTLTSGMLTIDLEAWSLTEGTFKLFSGLNFDGEWTNFLSFTGFVSEDWRIDYANGDITVSRIVPDDLYWASNADGTWSADDTNKDWAKTDDAEGIYAFAAEKSVHFGTSDSKSITVDGNVVVGNMEVLADGYTFSAAETGGSITVNDDLTLTSGSTTIQGMALTVKGNLNNVTSRTTGVGIKLQDASLTLKNGGGLSELLYNTVSENKVYLGGNLNIYFLQGAEQSKIHFAHEKGDNVGESDIVEVRIKSGDALPKSFISSGKGVNVFFDWTPGNALSGNVTWSFAENVSFNNKLTVGGNGTSEDLQAHLVVGKDMTGLQLVVNNALSSVDIDGSLTLSGILTNSGSVSVDRNLTITGKEVALTNSGTLSVGGKLSGAHLTNQDVEGATVTVDGSLELANRLTNYGIISVGGALTANNITHNKGQLTVTEDATTNEALALNGGTISVGKNLTVTTRLTANGGTLTVAGTLSANEIYVDGGTLVLSNDIYVASMGAGTFNRYGIDDNPELKAITVSLSDKYVDAFNKNMTFGKGVNAVFNGGFTPTAYVGTFTAEENVTFNGNMKVNSGTVSVGGDMTFNSSGGLTLSGGAGNISVGGDMTFDSGSLELNHGYAKIAVGGTLSLDSGNLNLTNGELTVGHLEMTGEAVLRWGKLSVTGSGETASTIGTLKVLGNERVELTLGEDLDITTIDAENAAHFTFSRYKAEGEEMDDLDAITVTIGSLTNHDTQDMTFGEKVNAHFTSSGTVRYSGELSVGGDATFDGELLLSDATVTVGGDLTTTTDKTSGVGANTGNLGITSSATVTVDGDASIAGTLQLNGDATVTVGKNLAVYNGVSVVANGASLEVTGNMTLEENTTLEEAEKTLDFVVSSSAEISIGGTLTLSRDLKVQGNGGATIDIGTDLTGKGSINVSATNGATITVDENMTLSTGSVNLGSAKASLTVKGNVTDVCNINLSASGAKFEVGGKLTMSNSRYNATIVDGATLTLGGGASIAGGTALNGKVYLNGGVLKIDGQLSGTGELHVNISEESTAQLQLSSFLANNDTVTNTKIQLGFDAAALQALVGDKTGYLLFTDNWQSSWLEYFDLYTLNNFSSDEYDITITGDGYLRIVALGNDLVWNDGYDTTNDWYDDNEDLTDWFYDDTTRATAFSNSASVKFLGTGETISLHGDITVDNMDVEGAYTFNSTDGATLTITGDLTIGEDATMTVSWSGVTVVGELDAEDGTLSMGSNQSITLQQGGTLGTLQYTGTQGNGVTLTLGGNLSIGTLSRQIGPLNINAMTGKEVTVSIDNGLQNVNTGTVNFGDGVNLTLTQSVNFGMKTVLNMAGGNLKVQGDFTGAQALTLNGNGTIEGKVTMTDTLTLSGTSAHSFTIKSTETSSIGTLVNGAASTFYLGGNLNITQLGLNSTKDNPIDNSGAITFNRFSENGTITVTIDGFQSVAGKDITFGTGVEAVFTNGLTGSAYTGTLTVAENASFGETNGLTVNGGTVDVKKNVTMKDEADLTLIGGVVSVGGNLTVEEGNVTVSGAGTLSVTVNLAMEEGTLTVSNAGANVTVGGTLSANVLSLSNGSVEVTGNASLTGTSEISGGSFTVKGSTGLTATGALNISGGTVTVDNNASIAGASITGGSFTVNGSTGLTASNAVSVSSTGSLTVAGTFTAQNGLSISGGKVTVNSLAVTTGDLTLSGGLLEVNNSLSVGGTVNVTLTGNALIKLGSGFTFGQTKLHLDFGAFDDLTTDLIDDLKGDGVALFNFASWTTDIDKRKWAYLSQYLELTADGLPSEYELHIGRDGHLLLREAGSGLPLNATLTWIGEDGTWGAEEEETEWYYADEEFAWSQGHGVIFESGEDVSTKITLAGAIEVAQMEVKSDDFTFTVNEGDASLTGTALKIWDGASATFTGDDAEDTVVSFGELSGAGDLTVSGSSVAMDNVDNFTGSVTVRGGELTLAMEDGTLALGSVTVSGGTLNLNAGASVTSLDASGKVNVTDTLSVGALSGGTNGVIDGGENGASLTVSGGTSYSGQLKDINVEFDLGSGNGFTFDGELEDVGLTVTSGTLTLGDTNTVDSLAFGADGKLEIEDGVTLTVEAALNGAGSISGDGALTLNGTTGDHDYSGSLDVGALTIDGTQTLSGDDVTVSGALTVGTTGDLTVGAFTAGSASVSGSLTLTGNAEISGVLELDDNATFEHGDHTVQVGGITGGVELTDTELVITGTDAAQSYDGNVVNADITVSGGQQTFTGSFSSSQMAINGGELTLTDASVSLGAVTATDGALTVGAAAAMDSLAKSGEGTLTLSGGAISVTDGITLSGTGRVDVTADSLDISGGLSFSLGTTLNSLDTAYLHGSDGNLLAALVPADGIALSIDGDLVRGTYYLATGLADTLGLDDFKYNLDALLGKMNDGLDEDEEWQLALDLTDGVLSLKVTYLNNKQWIWDGSAEGSNVWRDDSSDNWNQEDGGTNQGNRQVYFYGEGDGEIEVSGTVTPGAIVVKDGHYIFTSDGTGEGINLQGDVPKEDRNDDNEGGVARLVVGGDQTEAHVELNLRNKNIPLVDLLDNGKLTIGHERAVNEDAEISMNGGTLAIGENDGGALILTDLGKMTLKLEDGSALRLQVGKTYTEFDSADEYLGVSGVAMFAARMADPQTFVLTSGKTLDDALVNGIVKTGRQKLVVEIDAETLANLDNPGTVRGAMDAQEGTLTLEFAAAAEVASQLSVTTGATLRLVSAYEDTLTIKSSFESVDASAALADMLGEDAAARVELEGNVVLDGAVDNSAYAGVIALNGSVSVSAGASLGGEATELELDGGTLTLADEVDEVSVGTINVMGSQSISQKTPNVTLKAAQVIGAGTLATSAAAVETDDDTLTLDADLAEFTGTLQTSSTSWTLTGAQSSNTLGVSLTGDGEFIFSEDMTTGDLILTGTIGDGNSATDLVSELGGSIVIAGDGSGSTGSLTGSFRLGDAEHSGSWGGSTLADNTSLTLVNGELSGDDFAKGDGATLVADVVRGGAVNVNGMDGSNFDGITVEADGQLQNVRGTIIAGGENGITVKLVFDENSVGSSASGDYMITGDGTLQVEDAESLKLDFTNESFVDLLTKHRNEGAESWLHIFEGGSIEFGEAFDEAVGKGMLSSVLKASNLGKVLYELGFNVTVQGGDLVLTGTSSDVYLVVDGNDDVSNAGTVEGWYEGLGGHKATVVDGTLDVTAGNTDAEKEDFGYAWDEDNQQWVSTTDGTTKTDEELKAEKKLTDVQLAGVKNDQMNGGRTVNNLVGLEGSEFNAHHSQGNDYDPDTDDREQIVFNNSTVGSPDTTGLPGDAGDQLTENNGVDTVFEGTINADDGVDFVKKGSGNLTVGSESGKGGVKAADSDFTLEDGSFIVQGGDDNQMRDLVFSDGENEGGFGFTNGSKTTVESIVESDTDDNGKDGGNVSITDEAELVLTGESDLSDTHMTGDGTGTLTVDGEDGHLSFTGDGTEDAVLEDVNVTVQDGGSLELHDGASLSSTKGADVTVTGQDSSITLDEDSHLNTDGSLTLEDGGLLDLGGSSDNSAGQLNGDGTLAGGADSSLEVTGKGGVFSGTLAGATDGTAGGGTLKVGEGADLTLDNITTDANNKWQAEVDGALTVDVTGMTDGDQVDLDITLNEGSSLNVTFDDMSQLDSLQGELSVTGQADLTLTSDGKPPRSGQYDLGLTLDGDSDLDDLNLDLAGLAFSHFDGELKEHDNGQLYVDLTKLTHNDWMRPEQEKNAKAGATVFWDATDPDNRSYEYIQNHPDGDLAKLTQMLYWMNYNGDYAGMDRALAAGVGASTSTLSPAVNRDLHRQMSSLRNRVLMTQTTPEVPKAATEPNIRMWMSAESGYYNLSASGLAPGFTLNGWGGSVGMDTDVSPDVVVGFAITAMYNDLKTHAADAGKGDVDTTYLSAYARVQSGAWTHSFVVTGGTVDATLNRTVTTNPTLMFGFLPVAGQTYTTKGETTGIALGAMYEVGYTCAMNEAGTLALQPVANVQLAHSALSGYTETGSDAALNVGNMSQTQVTVGLGARLQGVLHEDALGRDAIFETRALVKGDFGDRTGKSSNSLFIGGTAAEVESARAGAVGIELGAGLSMPVGSAGGSIFADATVEFRNHANTFNATAGYRISF